MRVGHLEAEQQVRAVVLLLNARKDKVCAADVYSEDALSQVIQSAPAERSANETVVEVRSTNGCSCGYWSADAKPNRWKLFSNRSVEVIQITVVEVHQNFIRIYELGIYR